MGNIPMLGLSAGVSEFSSGALGPKQTTKHDVESAAQQFEGLLLHQLLKSASSEDGSWMGTGEEDTAGIQAMDLAQQQFAAALSARGGLGLAKMVVPQLSVAAKLTTSADSK
jgi:Rod binding domain-containing protein